jgi:hypothetical protein
MNGAGSGCGERGRTHRHVTVTRAADHAPDLTRVERFQEHVIGAEIQYLSPEALVWFSGNHHNGGTTRLPLRRAKDVFPRTVRKVFLAKDEIGYTLMQQCGGFPKGRSPVDAPVSGTEDSKQGLVVFLMGIDDQESNCFCGDLRRG